MIRVRHLLSAALALLIVITGCSGEQAATSPPDPAVRPTLKIGAAPYLSYAPLFIAQDEGFFADEGLDAEVSMVAGSATVNGLGALVNGDLDVLTTVLTPGIFNAINQGADVRIVADKGNGQSGSCPSYAFLVRTDLLDQGRVKSPADLRGMTITDQQATIPGYATEELLRQGGLGPDDVKQVKMTPPATLGGFSGGQLDMTSSAEPWISLVEEKGVARMWKDFTEVIPDGSWSVVVFADRLLRRDPELGRRFMAAYLRGVHQYNQGKTDRNVEIISRFTELDPAVVRKSCWMPISPDGQIHPAGIDSYLDWAHRRGFLNTVTPESKYWDPSFVEWVARNRPEIVPAGESSGVSRRAVEPTTPRE